MLLRVPAVRGFRAFADAGRALLGPHLGYEGADPYLLHSELGASASLRVEKMRYAHCSSDTATPCRWRRSGFC